MIPAFVTALALSGAGCGGPPRPAGLTPVMARLENRSLEGRWSTEPSCANGAVSEVFFSAGLVRQTSKEYGDPGCTGALLQEVTVEGRYQVGEGIAAIPGAAKIDVLVESVRTLPASPGSNGEAARGLPGAGVTLYQVFRLDGDRLYFGVASALSDKDRVMGFSPLAFLRR